jgi:hypothetical protein
VLCGSSVFSGFWDVSDDEDEVEAAEQGDAQAEVLGYCLVGIVSSKSGVRRCDNGDPRIECPVDAIFRNCDILICHGG